MPRNTLLRNLSSGYQCTTLVPNPSINPKLLQIVTRFLSRVMAVINKCMIRVTCLDIPPQNTAPARDVIQLRAQLVTAYVGSAGPLVENNEVVGCAHPLRPRPQLVAPCASAGHRHPVPATMLHSQRLPCEASEQAKNVRRGQLNVNASRV